MSFSDFCDIVVWAAYGMHQPNLIKYGSEVKYNRWHGNYIRCGVYLDNLRSLEWGPVLGVFTPGKITAFVEFEGNTLSKRRNLILFSEFEAEDWAIWSDGTVVFKRRTDISYYAYIEVRKYDWDLATSKERYPVIYSRFYQIPQEDVFRLTRSALDHVDGVVKKQLRQFFENFYFLPRVRRKFAAYSYIGRYDCLWVDSELEETREVQLDTATRG